MIRNTKLPNKSRQEIELEQRPDIALARAIVSLVDTQENLTPLFTAKLRDASTALIYLTDANDVSTDLDEYIGSLDDYISGQTDDTESIEGFRKMLETCYLQHDQSDDQANQNT